MSVLYFKSLRDIGNYLQVYILQEDKTYYKNIASVEIRHFPEQ